MLDNYFWLVVIPNLECFFGVLGCFGVVASIVCFYISFEQYAFYTRPEEYHDALEKKRALERKYSRFAFNLFLASTIIFLITCFIPTKKDIIQLKTISIISELKGADLIPQKLVDRLNDLLDSGEHK